MDRRIERTKKDLKEAFFQMLEQKNFENITVKDLSEAANINRGTFYLHFEDKYDMLGFYEDEIVNKIREIFEDFIPEKTDSKVTAVTQLNEDHIPKLIQTLNIFKEEKYYLKILLGPNGDPFFKEKVRQFFVRNVANFLSMTDTEKQLNYPIDYILTYISNAHISVIIYWLNEDTNLPTEEVVSMLIDIMLKGPLEASGITNIIMSFKKDN